MAPTLVVLLGLLVAVPLLVVAVIYLVIPVMKALGWLVVHVWRFLAGEVTDVLRTIGAVITALVFIPLVLINVVVLRWSAAAHFGRAVQSELSTIGLAIYRIAIGHPARLLGLTGLTEGIERRLPEVVAAAPGADRPAGRAGQFPGYTIVGSLPGGGSGGKLYVARPDAIKLAGFERSGQSDIGQVVIKSFSLHDGSSLPQIVRESRALEAARKMGLVLDHELAPDRFYYVMRYVPGESLGLVTQRLHAQSPSGGLSDAGLRSAMGYGADLVRTLDAYHRGGLWHKDVKPDNIIVDGSAAHLVDFGLVSSLRSSMTLTTHGTEYFRDPEMVRMALRGVKVHEVDGAKFDIYAAGAVLFSMVENSFPAHGGLSQITRRCPEALRWIIRRAMTDYDKRYAAAADLLADLEALRRADDPFAVRPSALPSMRAGDPDLPPAPQVEHAAFTPAAPAGPPRPAAPRPSWYDGEPAAAFETPARPGPAPKAGRPRLRVVNWWTGAYVAENQPAARAARSPRPRAQSFVVSAGLGTQGKPFLHVDRAHAQQPAAAPQRRSSLTASEQIAHAKERARARRDSAKARMAAHRRRRGNRSFSSTPNAGVGIALFVFLLVAAALGGLLVMGTNLRGRTIFARSGSAAPTPLEAPIAPRDHGDLAPADPEDLWRIDGLSVLVLREPATFNPAAAEVIESNLGRLASIGVRWIGLEPDARPDPADAHPVSLADDPAPVAEMQATLRRSIGLRSWDSDDAAAAIRGWLDDDDSLDAVLWIVPDPADVARPLFRLVPDAELDEPAARVLARELESPA